MRLILILFLLTPLWSQASEPQACAGTIDELKTLVGDHAFPLRWEESSMTDGKPLVVSIMQKEGALHLEFLKTREGLWAESAGVICRSGADLEAKFGKDQVRTGPAAHWMLRLALGKGGKFILSRLRTGQLHIATTGWSGTFSSLSKDAGAMPIR